MPLSGSRSRRQALNACDSCRRRKTKCDEQKPHCSRCTRLGLECAYIETVASKKSLSVTELADTLQRMNEKLDYLAGRTQPSNASPGRPRRQAYTNLTDPTLSSPHPGYVDASTPAISQGNVSFVASNSCLDSGRICDELSLSYRHSVAPQHLLTWPCSPLSLTELELQYPLDLEVRRTKMSRSLEPPRCLVSLATDRHWLSRLSLSQVNLLTHFYFDYFHPSCLVLDEATFYSQDLATAMRTNFSESLSTCVVLLVFALGSVAAYSSGHDEWSQSGEEDVGVGFFNLSNDIFKKIEGTDWVSVQCLLLMGAFYSAKLRVHDMWNVIHRACCAVLILRPLQRKLEAQHHQLFWIAYLQESQILAEFDFPASGLGNLAGITPLPLIPEAGTEPHHAQHQFFFLALISMRKLLNRILYHLYSSENGEDNSDSVTSPNDRPFAFLSASRAIIHELDRQLEEWRECLPHGLQFPTYSQIQEQSLPESFQPRSPNDRLRGHLIARYYSAKSIIHRPYVYLAFHCEDPTLLPDVDKAGARTAIHAALMSTAHSGLLHEPLVLLLHPINSCRTLFALELQLAFVLRNSALHFALPKQWRIVHDIRTRIAPVTECMSPTATRDFKIFESML